MKNNRKITLFGAVSIGIGGMVGGGIFAVLGEAVSLAHGATLMAFFIAGLVALLTSYSYAKLSVAYKSRGGSVTFIDNAFGQNLLSGSVNIMLWLSYLITISLYAVAFASYADTFFKGYDLSLLRHLFITIAIILPALINLFSASFVGKSESVIVGIKVILLIIITVFGFFYVDFERLSPDKWGDSISIVVAGMIIFVAYEGFELISNSSEEIVNPDKNLPLAFYISVISVIILYILIALITVGCVDENTLLHAKDYALAVAAKPALGNFGFIMVSIAALLATFSAINATIFGNSRLGYIIAKDGELPTLFEYQRGDTPFMGVVFTVILSLTLANSIDLNEIAIIGSAGFLLIFFIVNISALRLYKEIRANLYILISSSLFTLLALLILLYHTYSTNSRAVAIFFIFIILSISFEYIYGKFSRGHFFGRKY